MEFEESASVSNVNSTGTVTHIPSHLKQYVLYHIQYYNTNNLLKKDIVSHNPSVSILSDEQIFFIVHDKL